MALENSNGTDPNHVKTRNIVSSEDKVNNSSKLSVKQVDEQTGDITDFVNLEKLPEFQILNQKVLSIVAKSSSWERYGIDLTLLAGAVAGLCLSYFCLASRDVTMFTIGLVMMGLCYSMIAIKAGHNGIHGSLCPSKFGNQILSYFCSDFIGTFSTDVGVDFHIKCHHPHTNIIGLGDSEVFKAPFLPNFVYMFISPLLTPLMISFVALQEIFQMSALKIFRHLVVAYGGLAIHLFLLMSVSKLSLLVALLVTFASRNILSIPYIHVNVFQHIGLPMYSQKHRPRRLYQMTTGVLNLSRNFILDYAFGHGIISCHVEHHLFPRLSDNMCLKVKPVVEDFCKEYDLPYHNDSYFNRTKLFMKNYKRLMVNAPPITKFVGLQ